MNTKKYKTIQGMALQTNQLTFQHVLNERIYHNKQGWINAKIDNLDEIINTIVYDVIGGRKQNIIINKLYKGVSHWALERIIYCTHRKKFLYVAGQDYVWELNELRKYLYNL